jgi:uncharacterized caspase-like protein
MRWGLFCIAAVSLAFAGLGPALAQDQQRFALVIGASAYGENRAELEADGFIVPAALANATRDASLVADSLAAAGFEVDHVADPDKRTMLAAIGRFAEKLRAAGENGVGVFYFAGHGAQGRPPLERDIENYLIPLGVEMRTEEDLESEAMGLSRISATLSGTGAGAIVIIIDACRDFAMPQANRSSSNTRGLAEANAGANTLLAYSTAPGKVANDGPPGANGPYASALAREIRAARGSRIEDIFYAVRQDVRASTGGEQLPWENSSLERPVLVGVTIVVNTTDESDPVEEGAPSAQDQMVFNALATPCEYAMFARDFPQSPLRTLATTRAAGSAPCDEGGAAGRSSVEIVRRAQTLLSAMECGDVPTDGVVGTGTRAAAGRFREAHGLDGVTFDEAFIQALEDANVGGFVCAPEATPDPATTTTTAAASKTFEPPAFGEIVLDAGFSPDPHLAAIVAGGDRDASTVAAGCTGMIAGPPDYNVTYSAGFLPLYLTAASLGDVSLVVNLPNGEWACDDDSAGGGGGYNAGLTFEPAQSGVYNIWVGTVGGSGETVDATLFVSELGYEDISRVNADADPYYGQVAIDASFAQDPYSVYISAGGSNDASLLDSACSGMIGDSPDFNVEHSAGWESLYLSAASDGDTSLVVRTPEGTFVCNDDTNGLNPGVTLSSPSSGRYNVWVGRIGEEGTVASTLHISQTSYFDSQINSSGGAADVDWTAAATSGSQTLQSGFEPDPLTISLDPGGEVDASDVDATCVGNVAVAPNFSFDYETGLFPLYVYAESTVDTTLMVRTPSGAWMCDDDSGLQLNPGVGFKSPESGTYSVWVGRLGDATEAATLYVSETAFARD